MISSNTPAPAHGLYILDHENCRIGGAFVSAARLGLADSVNEAGRQGVQDCAFRLSLSRIRAFVAGSCRDVRAVLYGSNAIGQDCSPTWAAARRAGWETITYPRSRSGAEKRVDTSICLALLEETVVRGLRPDETDVTLISGDSDFVPALETLRRYGFQVDVLGWEHSTAADLRKAARRFVPLDEYFDHLTFRCSGARS